MRRRRSVSPGLHGLPERPGFLATPPHRAAWGSHTVPRGKQRVLSLVYGSLQGGRTSNADANLGFSALSPNPARAGAPGFGPGAWFPR